MNNKYCVYVHIVPNDKKYYGMTKNVKKRWRSNGRGYKQNINFYSDIITYGWDNIKHLIIADNLTKEEAELLEEELIRENRTYDSEYGYNKFIGIKWTDEQKEVLSETHKGKVLSKETRKKLSEAHKGHIVSDETRKKMSISRSGENNHMYGKLGANNPNAKKIICITTMMVFNCIKDAADYYSIDRSSITKCCKGKSKSAGKFNNQKLVWRYLYTKIL